MKKHKLICYVVIAGLTCACTQNITLSHTEGADSGDIAEKLETDPQVTSDLSVPISGM